MSKKSLLEYKEDIPSLEKAFTEKTQLFILESEEIYLEQFSGKVIPLQQCLE